MTGRGFLVKAGRAFESEILCNVGVKKRFFAAQNSRFSRLFGPICVSVD